jgi:STE24 endopeptidase
MSARTAAAVTLVVLVIALGAALLALTAGTRPPRADPTQQVAVDASLDFTAAQIDTGDDLSGRVRVPSLVSLGLSLAVALALGLTPLGARLADGLARPLGGGWVWQVLLGGLAVLSIVRVVTLPFGAWVETIRRDAGLSTRSWGAWWVDVLKGFGINTAVLLVVLLALVGLARAMPRWWWVPAATGAAVLVVVVSFLYPLVVEPVFNRFTPMSDGPLRTSLLQLAEKDGVPVEDVLVADASRRTSTLNAYVSGFGASRRIVVYDTLLDQAPDAEVRLVVAHELGHAADQDVLKGTLVGALGAATAVVALFLLMGWQPLLQRAGVSGMADGRVVALVVALVTVATLLTAPVQSWASRRIEARADEHALDLTRDPLTFAQMQRRLALAAKSDVTPNPLLFWWFGSHPSSPQRLAAARAWALAHDAQEPPPLAGTNP